MSNPTILQHFRSFCYQNDATNIEQAIEYFAVFGGMGWRVDFSKPLEELIAEKILKNYRYIHGDITKITKSNDIHHRVLSALATGDRREHSAFKKAKISKEEGENSVDYLIDENILTEEKSIEKPLDNPEQVSLKLKFNQPFMRFWFATVSPFYKGIKDGDFNETKKYWQDIKSEFTNYIYQQLFMEFFKNSYNEANEDKIIKIGSYWDTNTNIDLLAKTRAGKFIAGAYKFSKNKANKSELTKLKEKCETAQLDIQGYIIYSKNKFSTELKKEKGNNLLLFSTKSLNALLIDLNENDMLVNTNKKY